jgi:hypothetical protein
MLQVANASTDYSRSHDLGPTSSPVNMTLECASTLWWQFLWSRKPPVQTLSISSSPPLASIVIHLLLLSGATPNFRWETFRTRITMTWTSYLLVVLFNTRNNLFGGKIPELSTICKRHDPAIILLLLLSNAILPHTGSMQRRGECRPLHRVLRWEFSRVPPGDHPYE